MGIFEKAKKVLTNPSTFYDEIKSEQGLWKASKYYAVLLFVQLLLGALLNFFEFDIFIFVIGFPIAFILSFLQACFSVGITFIFAKMLKGQGNLYDTYKALFYAATPSLLLGWIPYVSILGALWTLYLAVKGVSKLHNVSMLRAFGIVIGLPLIIILVIAIILSAFAFAWFSSIFSELSSQAYGQVGNLSGQIEQTSGLFL